MRRSGASPRGATQRVAKWARRRLPTLIGVSRIVARRAIHRLQAGRDVLWGAIATEVGLWATFGRRRVVATSRGDELAAPLPTPPAACVEACDTNARRLAEARRGALAWYSAEIEALPRASLEPEAHSRRAALAAAACAAGAARRLAGAADASARFANVGCPRGRDRVRQRDSRRTRGGGARKTGGGARTAPRGGGGGDRGEGVRHTRREGAAAARTEGGGATPRGGAAAEAQGGHVPPRDREARWRRRSRPV